MTRSATHLPGEALMVLASGPANADAMEYTMDPRADPVMVARMLRLLADRIER